MAFLSFKTGKSIDLPGHSRTNLFLGIFKNFDIFSVISSADFCAKEVDGHVRLARLAKPKKQYRNAFRLLWVMILVIKQCVY